MNCGKSDTLLQKNNKAYKKFEKEKFCVKIRGE